MGKLAVEQTTSLKTAEKRKIFFLTETVLDVSSKDGFSHRWEIVKKVKWVRDEQGIQLYEYVI